MFLKKLLLSFWYAMRGFWFCVKNERNFRIHTLAALTVCLLAPYYEFTPGNMVLLTVVISLVVVCEMFNTAIESAVNLASPDYTELAKIAKDVSAGAVLIAAACAAACAFFLFVNPPVVAEIAEDVTGSPLKKAFCAVYVVSGYFYVRGFGKK